jgi:hypothetical protein
MANLVYAKITTNRSKLMKYIETFRKGKIASESLAAPRALPGTRQISYCALMTLEENSKLHCYFAELGKMTTMNKKQYEEEMGKFKHFWSA